MNDSTSQSNTQGGSDLRSLARDFAVQFLYQCETEKLFHFSEAHFERFIEHFQVPGKITSTVRSLTKGTLDELGRIDQVLGESSTRWSLDRMAATDRAVARLAAHELMGAETPTRVILNEAIDLAKKYGTEASGGFINGLLDKVAKALRPLQ